MVVLLSLGEALWSPRTYDYSMSVAPVGQEAIFTALAAAPLFAAPRLGYFGRRAKNWVRYCWGGSTAIKAP